MYAYLIWSSIEGYRVNSIDSYKNHIKQKLESKNYI